MNKPRHDPHNPPLLPSGQGVGMQKARNCFQRGPHYAILAIVPRVDQQLSLVNR
jgi:hypothetical protein